MNGHVVAGGVPGAAASPAISDAWFNQPPKEQQPSDAPEERPAGSGTAPIREGSNARKVALVAAAATTVIAGAIWFRGYERPRAKNAPTAMTAHPSPPASPTALPAWRGPTDDPVPSALSGGARSASARPPTDEPVPPAPSTLPGQPPGGLPAAPDDSTALTALPPLPVAPEPAPAPSPPVGAPPPPAVRFPSAASAAAPSPQAIALTARSQESFERGELPQAISLARSAARAGGGYRAYLIAGKALLADGRMAEAETELVRAAALAPSGSPDAATLLERVRARRQRLGE